MHHLMVDIYNVRFLFSNNDSNCSLVNSLAGSNTHVINRCAIMKDP
jgi:hypothetical protein